MTTWEEIIAALDALLASPPDTVEAVLSQLGSISQAIQDMVNAAAGEAATEDVVAAAEASAPIVTEKIAKVNAIIAKKKGLADLKEKAASIVTMTNTPAVKAPSNAVPVISGKAYGGKIYKSGEEAYKAGLFFAGALGNSDAQTKGNEKYGMQFKYQQSTNDVLGGYLVPDEVDAAIQFMREQYGAARQYCNVVTMNSQSRTIFRNNGGTNIYAVGEGQEVTESDIDFGKYLLRNGKFAALTKFTLELVEDAYTSIADEITKDHAFAHAKREDEVCFTSTGGSTYHNFTGLLYKWQLDVANGGGTWTTDADKAKHGGIVLASSSTWSGITLADLTKMPGRVRGDVPSGDFAYYANRVFFYDVIWPLLQAAGGQTQTERENGVATPMINGYPVRFIEVFPSATAVDDIPVAFGSMMGGVTLADRRGLTFDTDDRLGWKSDILFGKSSARYGSNPHDIGIYDNSTAANRTRGALVALATKHSG